MADPEAYRDFLAAFRDVSTADRATIDALTALARENSAQAPAFVAALEEAIRIVS
jgi:hypothetical protein